MHEEFFFGIERTHTRKDMARAVLESAGFTIRMLIDVIEEFDLSIDRIRLSGGLARINLVSQIKADITGKEIAVVDEFETTALGAAILAGVGVGTYSSIYEGASQSVNERLIVIPNRKNHEIYSEMYGLFNETYNSLKGSL
ncbi:hypothetical protein HMSSN036_23700 [Paenibacillus macerans]|nr:hypothetical protein HMSSN036_23700 [Paenibacillus macerans]